MKTPFDPRHKKREEIVKRLYTFGYRKTKQVSANIKPIIENLSPIDKMITRIAPDWPVEKLNRVDLAVLRLAIYELIIEKKNPEKVIIDEAVELAKKYGSENSPKFINGALGAALKKINKEKNGQS